ncbi:MAG: hypothetical protein DELT_02756 [Desulfovibrio sp.]
MSYDNRTMMFIFSRFIHETGKLSRFVAVCGLLFLLASPISAQANVQETPAQPASGSQSSGQADSVDQFNQQLLENARKNAAQGGNAKALNFYVKFLESYPTHQKALREAAQVAVKLGNQEEANRLYINLLRINPDNPSIMYQFGLLKLRMHQEYEAQEALFRALGSGKLNRTEAEGAREAMSRAYDNWDVFNAMRQHNDHAAQERFLTYQIEKQEEKKAAQYAMRGYARHWQQNLDGALSDFTAALELGGLDEQAESSLRQAKERIENDLQARDRSEQAQNLQAEAAPETPKPKAVVKRVVKSANPYPYFEELDALFAKRDFDQAERVLGKLSRFPLRDKERGIYLYYRAELDWNKGEHARAYEGFRQASRLMREKYRLSTCHLRMAEYHAMRGDTAQAATEAEKAASLLPDQAWRLSQAADLLARLGLYDKAVAYYESSLLQPKVTASGKAHAHMGLANIFRARGDRVSFLTRARAYIETQSGREDALSEYEKGMTAYYQGLLHDAAGDKDAAFASYEQASRLVTEKYALSEIYMNMAQYCAGKGEKEQAATYAAAAADLLPAESWRVGPAADIFRRAGQPEKGIAYVRQAIDLKPSDNRPLYKDLSSLYRTVKDRDSAKRSNVEYIDYLYEQIDTLGAPAAPGGQNELKQELWEARERQTSMARTWGLDMYSFGNKKKNGDYYLGMSNELFHNYSLPNGYYGKVYAKLNGTLADYYSGTFTMADTGQRGEWESRSNMDETMHGILGARISPIRQWGWLTVSAEYLTPIGNSDVDDDFRGLVTVDAATGQKPRITGNNWLYAKLYNDAFYSTRLNDFHGYGDLKLGQTLVGDWNRNLLFMPHLGSKWSYDGQTAKARRWKLQAGPGLTSRFWFNEDKYHAPKSYIELGVYHHWELSHGRGRTVGFNFTLSF